MIYVTVGDIKRGKILIPGGWRAVVWQVDAELQAIDAYTKAFDALGVNDPEQAAKYAVQNRFEAGFLIGLRASIGWWAERYAKLFPDSIQQDGTLQGYDPEVAQQLYVPTARGRLRGADELLKYMRENK